MNTEWEDLGKGTTAAWAGESTSFADHSAQVPVYHSVTFSYDDLDEWFDVALGKKPGHIYSRNTNPTVAVFEEKVRVLEGADAATSFATGMAAISNTLFELLEPGDRVVTIKDAYGGTNKIFLDFLPKQGIDVCLCDTEDFDQIESEVQKGCQLLYLETPTNPTLKVMDIQRLSAAAHGVGALVVVDNTFATPINQRPLELGADLVLHSATKFLGGHSDALGGVICGSNELVQRIFHYREITGATLQPMSAYLLLRGMKTLELRVERQNASALRIAQHLHSHPAVSEVFYPGLDGHRHHDVAKRQMRGFGGMLSFSLIGDDFESVKTLLTQLRFAKCAASLGCVQTLVGPPKTTSHVETSAEERKHLGIPETLIRYSTGIENPEDLIQDLNQALDAVSTPLRA